MNAQDNKPSALVDLCAAILALPFPANPFKAGAHDYYTVQQMRDLRKEAAELVANAAPVPNPLTGPLIDLLIVENTALSGERDFSRQKNIHLIFARGRAALKAFPIHEPAQAAVAVPDICAECKGERGHEKALSSTNHTWVPCPTCSGKSSAAPVEEAAAAQPDGQDAQDREFTAIRLRAVCNMLGLATAVPDKDDELLACMFSVLGMVRRKIEALQAAPPMTVEPVTVAWMHPISGAVIKAAQRIEGVTLCDFDIALGRIVPAVQQGGA